MYNNHVTINGLTLNFTSTTISYNNKVVYVGTVNMIYLTAIATMLAA